MPVYKVEVVVETSSKEHKKQIENHSAWIEKKKK